MVRSTSRRPTAQPRLEPLETRVLLDAAALLDGPLPLPPQFHLVNPGRFLTNPSAAPAQEIARNFLRAQTGRLGLTAADLSQLLVTRDFVDAVIGATHLTFQQTLHGLPIFNANVSVNVSARGEIINAGGGFVSQLGRFAASPRPTLSPTQAVVAAARQLDVHLAAASTAEYPATLQYVALPDQGLALTWNVALRTLDGQHWYNVHADAATGNVVSLIDWVSHFRDPSGLAADHRHGPDSAVFPGQQGGRTDGASYNVYSRWVPSPDWGGRLLEVEPSDPYPSPFGWHDTNGVPGAEFTDTRGNNVDARRNNVRPDGGSALTFDFPIDFTQQPATYLPAATTNLFYWNNFLHDIHYRYGFTPAARNFQTNTYGMGGVGNDRVNANCQASGGINNANFSTPPDGMSGTMNMYLWNRTNPMRDGDLDNFIIVHEYGHGVSNRLTGNANGLGAIQSRGMGEGWSDWWGLMFTQYYEQEALWGRGAAPYVLGQDIFGPGIRRFRYSYDTAIHPLTLGSYNSTQAVHATGEVWANTLWGMNHLLIQRHGFNIWPDYGWTGQGDAGNVLALQLVMLGLMLQPNNPSFSQARDAILAADVALTGGENQLEIWTAFARRGFGFSMVDGGSASRVVTEAFDLPRGFAPGGRVPENSNAGLVAALLASADVAPGFVPPPGQADLSRLMIQGGIDQQLMSASRKNKGETIQERYIDSQAEDVLSLVGLDVVTWDVFGDG